MIDFRVHRSLRDKLMKILRVIDRHVMAAEVQQREDRHRSVTVREHGSVGLRPVWIGRVVAQVATPANFCDIGHAHRHARVNEIDLLDRVHLQGADGVDQGGRSSGHDDSPIQEMGFSRMCKLSAKTGGFATFRIDAGFGIAAGH
jgi:hypothetical protein